jgi:hypothetical protein
MSKYEPLQKHLEQASLAQVPMTFAEIEAILGFSLPPSSRRYRAWWSNNALNSAITDAWLRAGYHSEQVDMQRRRLVFRRTEPRVVGTSMRAAPKPERHPLLGCMKGTVTEAPGFDPTAPADPDWGSRAYGARD